MRFQDAFSNLVPKIATKYANTYAGASMAPAPGDPAEIRFKGAVPPAAAADIAASGLTIDVKGGAKYTQKEIRERSTAIARYLMTVGYTDVVTAVMPAGFVEVTIGSSTAPRPVLPPSLREDARITVIEGPANREENVRGGAQLQLPNNVNWCTSGFTVTSFGGTDGVSTAGHCDGLDDYSPPSGDDYDIDLQAEHLGLFGDVQWHTSDETEPAEYYATSTEIRDQDSVESWSRHHREQRLLRLRPRVEQPRVRRGLLRLRERHLRLQADLVARRHDRRQHDRWRQRPKSGVSPVVGACVR